MFYQEGLDGVKVAVTADHPGALPSSLVSEKKTLSQPGRSSRAIPQELTSARKGRRTTRKTVLGEAETTPASPPNGTSKWKASFEAEAPASSAQR